MATAVVIALAGIGGTTAVSAQDATTSPPFGESVPIVGDPQCVRFVRTDPAAEFPVLDGQAELLISEGKLTIELLSPELCAPGDEVGAGETAVFDPSTGARSTKWLGFLERQAEVAPVMVGYMDDLQTAIEYEDYAAVRQAGADVRSHTDNEIRWLNKHKAAQCYQHVWDGWMKALKHYRSFGVHVVRGVDRVSTHELEIALDSMDKGLSAVTALNNLMETDGGDIALACIADDQAAFERENS